MSEAHETANQKGIWFGKAPASPNAISKLVADVIPASGQQPVIYDTHEPSFPRRRF